jgi:hypothetical protein
MKQALGMDGYTSLRELEGLYELTKSDRLVAHKLLMIRERELACQFFSRAFIELEQDDYLGGGDG